MDFRRQSGERRLLDCKKMVEVRKGGGSGG